MSRIVIQENNNPVIVLENAIGPQGPPGPPGTGSFGPIITVNDDYVLSESNDLVMVDASDQDVNIIFPAAYPYEGYRFTVKKIDSSEHTVTLRPPSGEAIEDDPEVIIYLQNVSLTVASDGMSWRIV